MSLPHFQGFVVCKSGGFGGGRKRFIAGLYEKNAAGNIFIDGDNIAIRETRSGNILHRNISKRHVFTFV